MKHLLPFFAVFLVSTGIAAANPYELTNGAVIAHAPPNLIYSGDFSHGCDAYVEAPISSCEEQVNRIDNGTQGFLWYVLLAWAEPKYWHGFEFGLRSFVAGPEGYLIMAHDLCPARLGVTLSIPTAHWPGPNEGIAMACTDVSEQGCWSGNFEPMYWFAGYAYVAQRIPLGPNPATGHLAILPLYDHAQPVEVDFDFDAPGMAGSMGMLTDGVAACPPLGISGACCLNSGQCVPVSLEECDAQEGLYQGAGTSCDPNPCLPRWGCCLSHGTNCIMMTEQECASHAGLWQEGQVCEQAGGELQCELVSACCIAFECVPLMPSECEAQGGVAFPQSDCADIDCALPSACCVNGECLAILSPLECEDLGGIFFPQVPCDSPGFTCPAVWACCFSEDQRCYMLTIEECQNAGGESFEGVFCESDNPCEESVPSSSTSWGAVKALYK